MPHGIAVEEPITSYFRRINASNRKQNHILSSTANRQHLLARSSQAEDANEPKKPRTWQKLASSDASRKRSKLSHGKTRIPTPNTGTSSVAQTTSHAFPLSSTPQLGNEHELLPLSSDIGSVNKRIDIESSSGIGQATFSRLSRQFKGVADGRKQC